MYYIYIYNVCMCVCVCVCVCVCICIYILLYYLLYMCVTSVRKIYIHTHTKCQHLRNSEISFATALVRTLCWCAFLGTLSRAESLFCQGQKQHGDARAQIFRTSYCTLHVQVRVLRQGQKAVSSNVSCSTDATPARSALCCT